MTNNALKFKAFLNDKKSYLKTVIFIFFVWGISYYAYGITEPGIRRSGLVFQVSGISTVIWGILITKTYFGFPHPKDKIKMLISKFINFISKFINKVKSWLCSQDQDRNLKTYIGTGSSQHAINVYGPHRKFIPMEYEPGTNHTIESLAEILKENVNSIHERISKTQKEMDEDLEETTKNLKREEHSRQTEDNAIRHMLSSTIMGGFDISTCGAILLFLGAIFSTAPNEIVKWYESKADIATYLRPDLIPGINIHLT